MKYDVTVPIKWGYFRFEVEADNEEQAEDNAISSISEMPNLVEWELKWGDSFHIEEMEK